MTGDQSSGKSSVLESVTGFSFPRAAGLCTRYATQITCIREAERKVSISIIPRPDAEGSLKERLLAFHRELSHMTNEDLARVFEEACLSAPTSGLALADSVPQGQHRDGNSDGHERQL